MKHIKKTIIIFTMALFCLVPFFATSMTARAEESVTYYLRYVEANGEWRFQTGAWADDGFHRELYYMHQAIKDGDKIVIQDATHTIDLTVNVRLSNLTVATCPLAVVTANGIDEVYIINDGVAAINSDVTYAEVYDSSRCNFNQNVGTLKVLSQNDFLTSSINVLGTVDHLYGAGKVYKHFEYYNFEAGSLVIEKGIIKTDKSKYSDVPPAATPAPAPSTNTGSGASSGEYDDVPKTGDIRFNPLWLVMIAGVCLAGAYRLKKN